MIQPQWFSFTLGFGETCEPGTIHHVLESLEGWIVRVKADRFDGDARIVRVCITRPDMYKNPDWQHGMVFQEVVDGADTDTPPVWIPYPAIRSLLVY